MTKKKAKKRGCETYKDYQRGHKNILSQHLKCMW